MNTYDKLKQHLLRLRKSRQSTSFISFLLGECDAVGKKKNRLPTEDEVQSVIKKILENTQSAIDLGLENKISSPKLEKEVVFLKSLRPEMVDDEDLLVFIETNCKGLHIGQAMGLIKKEFGVSVDMGKASKYVRELE